MCHSCRIGLGFFNTLECICLFVGAGDVLHIFDNYFLSLDPRISIQHAPDLGTVPETQIRRAGSSHFTSKPRMDISTL